MVRGGRYARDVRDATEREGAQGEAALMARKVWLTVILGGGLLFSFLALVVVGTYSAAAGLGVSGGAVKLAKGAVPDLYQALVQKWGDRCAALSGKVGEATACTIYAVRPEVCRTCMPGDVECQMARKRHGLPALI